MSHNSNLEEDEIDLSELLAAIWSHKIIISLIMGLSIFFAGYKALTTEKMFTAQAIFQIEETNNNSGFNLSGELGALASLAGLSGNSRLSNSQTLIERLSGREFIAKISKKFALDLDPFFNTFDPEYVDPFWKATIKRLIGWQKQDKAKMPL